LPVVHECEPQMNTREVGLLLMVVWLVALWASVSLSKRWRRSGVVGSLYASYATTFTGLVALDASLWFGDNSHPWDHWFLIAGVIATVLAVPWTVWSHRREVQKYGIEPTARRPAVAAPVRRVWVSRDARNTGRDAQPAVGRILARLAMDGAV